MIYLLDTNALSDLMRRDPRLEARLDALAAGDDVVICSIVRGEVGFGIARMPAGRRRADLEQRRRELLPLFPCEPVSESAADYYASVKLAQQQRGASLDENDLWIAATALALNAVLVTRDTDFSNVPGLRVADWTRAAP